MLAKLLSIYLLCLAFVWSSKLVGVVEYCRHGARAPRFDYDQNPHHWAPNQPYELTQMGLRQHYLIGQELRRRYVGQHNLLPFFYNPKALQVIVTDTNRTLMSAQAQLKGLYPLGTGPILENEVQFNSTPPYAGYDVSSQVKYIGKNALPYGDQPIPIIHLQIHNYIVDTANWNCPKQLYYENQFLQTEESKQYMSWFNENLRQKLSNLTSVPQEQVDHLFAWFFYDLLKCNKFHGYPNYPGVDQTLIDNLIENDYWIFFKFFQPNQQSTQLRNGAFYSKLLNVLDAKISNPENEPHFTLFSGHDDALAALLQGFLPYQDGQKEAWQVQPPFASTIIFELWQKDQQTSSQNPEFFIKTMYNDQEISIQGCEIECPYTKFKEIFNEQRIEDPVSNCELTWQELNKFNLKHLEAQLRSIEPGKEINEHVKSYVRRIKAMKQEIKAEQN